MQLVLLVDKPINSYPSGFPHILHNISSRDPENFFPANLRHTQESIGNKLLVDFPA